MHMLERRHGYELADLKVDTEGWSADQVIDRILQALTQDREHAPHQS
jgi:hypothetical protein